MEKVGRIVSSWSWLLNLAVAAAVLGGFAWLKGALSEDLLTRAEFVEYRESHDRLLQTFIAQLSRDVDRMERNLEWLRQQGDR